MTIGAFARHQSESRAQLTCALLGARGCADHRLVAHAPACHQTQGLALVRVCRHGGGAQSQDHGYDAEGA